MDKHEALYKDVSSLEVVAYTTRDGDFEDGVIFILEKLDAIPVADVQPVQHGKWVCIFEPDENGNVQCNCSVCGAGDLHARDTVVPYCWKCGAKMDGEKK